MTEPRRFDLRELAGGDDAGGDAELGAAFAAARALESAVSGPDARPSPELADRIMAAIAREPAPHPLGILAALRRRPGLGGLVESVRVAWGRGLASGRPLGVRASALAYVVAVVVLAASLTGVAAYTTAGAIGLFGPSSSHTPVVTPGVPTPLPLASPRPGESESPEPSETPEASAPEPSGDHAGTGASTEPGDQSGGGSDGSSGSSAPGASDDGGGDSVSSGATTAPQTPRPSATPRASGTPGPTSSSG